jgi:hypothetical protein
MPNDEYAGLSLGKDGQPDNILKAADLTAGHKRTNEDPAYSLWEFYPEQLADFAAALTEPLEARIAELVEALEENMYSNSTGLAIKLATEAMANKSEKATK